jgi:hypothetical protein
VRDSLFSGWPPVEEEEEEENIQYGLIIISARIILRDETISVS